MAEWKSAKKFAQEKGVNYDAVRQAVSRANKADKKFCKIGSKYLYFRYIYGIGHGGKVLQIYSEPIQSATPECVEVGVPIQTEVVPTQANTKSITETPDISYFTLTAEQKEEANKKLCILKEYEKARKRGVCVVDFLKVCDIEHPEYALNEAKLFRWRRDYKKSGITALADKRGVVRAGSTSLDEWMQEFVLTKFRAHGAGKMNFLQLRDALHKEAHFRVGYDYYGFIMGEVKSLCGYGTIKRFIENYYKANSLEYLMVTKGEDKAKSYRQPAMGNQKEIVTYRNQEWQIDSSPLDVIVLDKDGKQIRPFILSIIDTYSGRCVASLNKTSNSLALIRLLWKAFSKLGKPTYIKGDNGKDYLSKQFQELLNGLGIDYDRAIAYSGDEKGSVERHFGVMQHSDISFAHGYIGSCLRDREAIEQRTPKRERTGTDNNGNAIKTNQKFLMTFEEAEALLEETVLKWDIMRVRRKSDLSPLDRWNACNKELVGVDYAKFLLYASEGVNRIVGKKGLSVEAMVYVSKDLPPVGTEVVTRHNIDNLQEIYVFDAKGNFLCTAWDREIAALSAEDYKLAKKMFREDVKAIRKLIRSAQASEFTKLHLAYDLEKMQDTHRKSLKSESMAEDGDISALKQQLKEEREIRAITGANFDAPEIKKQPKQKRVTWEDVVNGYISESA
jgi:hypothetical protein